MAKIAIAFLCLAPTIYEAISDRKGESKRDKFWDGLILVGYSVLLAGGAYLSGHAWVPVIGLILVIRFAIFDYLTHFFLKRYSPGHKDINICMFTGTVAYFDRLTAKIDWRIRLGLRVAVLLSCLAFYFLV